MVSVHPTMATQSAPEMTQFANCWFENAIEVRWVMAKLLQRALGFGVERVESLLSQRDVQSPRLAGGTICHRSSSCSQPQSRGLLALEERA
jgi:hypothetical protein